MPFTHYRTQGIFLKKEGRGEADQLFTIWTEDFGKLEILGRAIRKIKSKLRSGAELFYFSEIEFIQGKTYKTLTDAILIDKFRNLRESPQKLNYTYQIAEVLDSLTGKEEKDDEIWNLLSETFRRLDNWEFPEGKPLASYGAGKIIYYYFLWNLFSILGFKPEIHSCPICQKLLLPETFWFVPKEGGIVCWKCFKKLSEEEKKLAEEISVDTVKILRLFLSEDWKILPRIKITEEVKRNLKEISELYLNFLREEFSKMEK
ncbi:DNA repair protein RecO [Patescibacteria group bacterium]|nr:DNA repair protein RecO [Patescibacteria group bacterium]